VTRGKIVADNIHGDIHLTAEEWRVIDTAPYQRLRNLKQLQMGHLTYPNATHTRFAHSLGVFSVMTRVLDRIKTDLDIDPDQEKRLRFAALLHDIGHYPYSHLMEKVDKVLLTEELVRGADGSKVIDAGEEPYPDHEEVGGLILSSQQEIRNLIGGEEEARKIAQLFRRTEEADAQSSKLIHSSLDMDRLDYLLRDSQATGTPYGKIDLDYLLNNVKVSPKGILGVTEKALPAAEHFLLARLYMHRTVYWHKTTFGFEEACKQLLRRIRNDPAKAKKFGLAGNGTAIQKMVMSPALGDFTDAYVDRIIQRAAQDSDPVIAALGRCITGRRAPKLLREVSTFSEEEVNAGTLFRSVCKYELPKLAEEVRDPVGTVPFC